MRKLSLAAVGSGGPIAGEIKEITESLLGPGLPVTAATVGETQKASPDTFYICATTQREALSEVIPEDRLFVFDLRPTTLFFLDIAKLPAGAEVYVFNNLRPYTELLARECRALGIDSLDFRPLPYAQMPDDEVRKCLREARYIIGVDCMVGENVLLSEKYRSELRPDVRIIPGKRAASIASASKLLAGIAGFYLGALAEERERAAGGAAGLFALAREAERIFSMLQAASLRAVTSRIGGQDSAPEGGPAPEDIPEDSAEASSARLAGQMDAIRFLQKKLAQLGA